ncbi:hypothetical protein SAMN05428961_105371 [Paenibacillus sp. OK060]|nr:hypothetical protein SAMN05428961_105371 [Paenibacillus sp. OK060]
MIGIQHEHHMLPRPTWHTFSTDNYELVLNPNLQFAV